MENTSRCLGKTVSKRTRSNTKHRILATHRQTSELHRAISSRNRLDVKNLLKKGEKLCADVGINCFILAQSVCSWDFVRYLLALDIKGLTAKNFDGVTLLMLYAHAHDLKVVEELLKLGANPNDTANDNRTALIMAVTKTYRGRVYFDCSSQHFRRFKEHKDIIDVLVAAGADASVCTTTGENVLHFACKNYYTFTTEVFDTLIKAGANPVVMDNEQCTVLSHAMSTFCDICASLHFETAKSVCLPALQFLLGLPQFNSGTLQFNCPSSKHPQSILLQHLFLCQSVMENSFKMTDLIANKLFPKNTELVVNIPMIIIDNRTSGLVTENQYQLPFGPLALVLNFKRESFLREKSQMHIDPQEILTTLMSYGYSLSLQFTETISPLTVVLLDPIMFPHYCIGDYLHTTKYLIQHGVHVEQRMVPFDDQNDLDELGRNMFLPDALRVAVTYRHLRSVLVELVKLLLPYFAPPPLALLPFVMPSYISTLFPVLAAWGPLHNTPLQRSVQTQIELLDMPDDCRIMFHNMHRNPARLQDMCRTTVRMCIAPQAAQHGNSLPGLIKSIKTLAPGLRDFLLMST